MKRSRKGFTLVELLIVVAILVTLTAAMTVSMNGSTAKAKAAQIVANVGACKTVATLYYSDNLEVDLSEKTTTSALAGIPDIGDFNKGAIKYTPATDSEKGPSKWAIVVDFTADGDETEIATALKKIKRYKNVDAQKTFSVNLLTGIVTVPNG